MSAISCRLDYMALEVFRFSRILVFLPVLCLMPSVYFQYDVILLVNLSSILSLSCCLTPHFLLQQLFGGFPNARLSLPFVQSHPVFVESLLYYSCILLYMSFLFYQ